MKKRIIPKEDAGALLDAAAEAGLPIAAIVPVATSPLALPPPAKSRRRGPARRTVVTRVVDKESGVGVDVVFDAESCQFEAVIPGYPQSILGSEAAPVIEQTKRILRATREYQWKPSIVVDAGGHGRFWDEDTGPEVLHRAHHSSGGCEYDVVDATLAIRFYRIEIAPKPGDPTKFVCRPHAEDVAVRGADRTGCWGREPERRANGQDVGHFLERDRAVVLPYTPETWAAVQQAAADVLAVGDRLRALLGRPEALAAAGARLLEAGAGAGPLALPPADDDDAT